MRLLGYIKKFLNYLKVETHMVHYTPTYKLVEIFQDEHSSYLVTVQMINKSACFNAKPEELLADDKIVDLFSPRDVRTLTYLGYLEINSPKYQILAKKLAAGNDRFIFALKKRGQKTIITKTAAQIINENEIMSSLDPTDAKTIGYTVAIEDIKIETKQKKALLESRENLNEPI